jgi:hypothetical protein
MAARIAVCAAKAIVKISPAVATSSAAVASALGYADGEDVPLDMVTGLVSRMTAAVSVPVSIDLEAGYGDTPDAAAESMTEILKAAARDRVPRDGFGGWPASVGVGVETADLLVHELLSRPMRDRRAVARYAGLRGSPDESGARRRKQGLARAGNARVRRAMTSGEFRW